MEVNHMIKLIQEVSNSNLSSFKYEEDNFTIELCKDKAINQEIYKSLEEENNDKHIIKSPIVGTFYRSPSEDGSPFIEVGDEVKKGQVIAIVEAMKIMNEIESTFDGVVEEILVENQDVVEYGQPLVVIKP